MPTKKQIENAVGLIKDVISRDYVVLRGTEYLSGGSQPLGWSLIDPPEKLFPMLETADKIAVLGKYVDWEGFDDDQKRSVIQWVVDGYSPKLWMDGIEALSAPVFDTKSQILELPPDSSMYYTGERAKALQAEMQHDSGLAHLRDREVKYEDAATPNAEFKAVQDRLPSPSEVAKANRLKQPGQDHRHDKSNDHDAGHSM